MWFPGIVAEFFDRVKQSKVLASLNKEVTKRNKELLPVGTRVAYHGRQGSVTKIKQYITGSDEEYCYVVHLDAGYTVQVEGKDLGYLHPIETSSIKST